MSLYKRIHEGQDGEAPSASRRDPVLDELRQKIHHHLIEELGPILYDKRLSEDDLRRRVQEQLQAALAQERAPLSAADKSQLIQDVSDDILGYGPIDRLLNDDTVTEVMVNGPTQVFIEQNGKITKSDATFVDATHLRRIIDKIVGQIGRRVDEASPMVDARLPDGSRVNVVVPPLAIDGPCLTIRRFGARAIPLAELCPPGVAELLAWAVAVRANIVVSGGTGAGKTTLLNALAGHLPTDARIVTVEDTAELRLRHHHVVRLEARPATADGVGGAGIRDLVRNALRMRPDRIVVGEVRGPEALDMLWAMNTGHEGSLSTVHANSPVDALRRLELMVLSAGLELPLAAVRDQLTSALDLVVQVARIAGGGRRVVAVSEVVDPSSLGERVRVLAGPDGLHALPVRPTRAAGARAPDPGGCR
jgi:pilus assembly protein CpaF